MLKRQVQVFHEKDGRESHVANLGPGEYFGEMALLQGIRRTASIRAVTPVDILMMSGGRLYSPYHVVHTR